MNIKKIIDEEVAKVVNQVNNDRLNAFVDQEHIDIERLPTGEMIFGVE